MMAWWPGGRGWRRGRGGWGPWWGPRPPAPVQVPVQLPEGTKPLSLAMPGERVVVQAIMAGQGATARALSLGLAPGTVVEVVENNMAYPWTPIIVRVHGVEIAIGRGLASKIYVKPLQKNGGTPPGGEKQEG